MAPHDPLFKSLFRTFFTGFLRLLAPELADQLELSDATFLDKEFPATDPPARSRVVDLLVRVPLKQAGGKTLLIHVEIEARARKGIGERLRSYHRWIQTRHEEQILSVVVFLRGGRAGVLEQTLANDLAGPGLTVFRYLAFGVAGCRAAEYLVKPEPLAWALAALMDPGSWSRAQLKMRCLTRIAGSPLSQTQRSELVDCVETYLQLTPGEAEAFSRLSNPTGRRAQTMLYIETWSDRMKAEGARQVVLSLLEQRFGVVPAEVRTRVEKIRSLDRLTRLAQKAVTAKSFKSLRLG